jgi:branched-chain amino acid transport system ATP-binding protein
MRLFEVKNLCKFFGGLKAVNLVNFTINKGEIVGLIGPNGAGKTTLFNCITGFYRVTSGKIFFKEKEITDLSSESICRKGIARTFQIPRTFKNMTVLDNVIIGAFCKTNNLKVATRKALDILNFTGLINKKDYPSNEITLADEKILSIARVLATDPEIILLDEAMSGLTPLEAESAIKTIGKIRSLKISLIIVEHVMEIVMPISDRVIVIRTGEKIADGPPLEVSRNEEVIKSYLGGAN